MCVGQAYNGGLGGAPSGVQGRAPGWESGGRNPLKPKVFQLSDVQQKWQNCLILPILQSQ